MAKKATAISDLIFVLGLLAAHINEKKDQLTGEDLEVVESIRDALVGRLQKISDWELEEALMETEKYLTDTSA